MQEIKLFICNKMVTFGKLLPKDLLLELGLYLNYRDIWGLIVLDENILFNPKLWINKIHEELGYDNEFIKQYVYNTSTEEKMTQLPLNEKYSELKSRKGVDF